LYKHDLNSWCTIHHGSCWALNALQFSLFS